MIHTAITAQSVNTEEKPERLIEQEKHTRPDVHFFRVWPTFLTPLPLLISLGLESYHFPFSHSILTEEAVKYLSKVYMASFKTYRNIKWISRFVRLCLFLFPFCSRVLQVEHINVTECFILSVTTMKKIVLLLVPLSLQCTEHELIM